VEAGAAECRADDTDDITRPGERKGENGRGHFGVLVLVFREATRPSTPIVGAGATRAERLRLRPQAPARASHEAHAEVRYPSAPSDQSQNALTFARMV